MSDHSNLITYGLEEMGGNYSTSFSTVDAYMDYKFRGPSSFNCTLSGYGHHSQDDFYGLGASYLGQEFGGDWLADSYSTNGEYDAPKSKSLSDQLLFPRNEYFTSFGTVDKRKQQREELSTLITQLTNELVPATKELLQGNVTDRKVIKERLFTALDSFIMTNLQGVDAEDHKKSELVRPLVEEIVNANTPQTASSSWGLSGIWQAIQSVVASFISFSEAVEIDEKVIKITATNIIDDLKDDIELSLTTKDKISRVRC